MEGAMLSESCPSGTIHTKVKPECTCGYLNVKTLQLGPEKKSKDRQWHCYWAQVSEDQLLLYKVESASSHTSNSHPPMDKEIPAKHQMHEVDHISLAKAVIGLEYTYKAEAKNRRRYLFRITQENGADYLLQAPSDGAAVCWSETLRNIAGRYADHAVDEDFIREIAIKRMREGEKKVGKAGKGAAINAPILPKSAPPVDPLVLDLKNTLQKKIDLLYHLKEMEKAFSNQLQPRTPSPEVAPQFNLADGDNQSIRSPSELSTGRHSTHEFERREATMVKNYHLIAGAAWSLLKKGEKVIVLQQLPTGYYLVKATRNTIVKLSMLEVKRNVSETMLVSQNRISTNSEHYSEPSSPHNMDDATPIVSILVQQSSDCNLVPSDSFQSNISDDSGIVESSKRTSNVSTKDEEEDKSTSETSRIHMDNGDVSFDTTFKAHSTSSLPTSIMYSRSNSSKLPTPPASSHMSASVSFGAVTEYSSKDLVSLPLIGSVPPSALDCYANQMFSPTLIKPHASNLVLQPPPAKSLGVHAKKKKTVPKGNRLSLQVDNLVNEESPKNKSNTLPLNSASSSVVTPTGNKPEKTKRAFKSFFKKRLSTHGKIPSFGSEGEIDKEYLSVREESLPPDLERVQSPVYEYTPVTNTGQEFRRRGQSFVYAIGESSSESESDDESSDKSNSSHSRRKHRKDKDSSTPPSDKRLSVTSTESSTKDEVLFEMSMESNNNSPQNNTKALASDRDVKEKPERHNSAEEASTVVKRQNRSSLKKMKSLPTTIGKDDTVEEEEDDKQTHRLSAGEFPSIEISMRAPPLNKRRHVYLDSKVQKFGFRLETYGRISLSGDVTDTVVYTVTQGSAAFLAGMYPGDVIVEVEGVDVSNKNCNELGSIIASYKKSQQVICLTVKFIDGVRRLDLMKMEQKNQKKTPDRNSTASSDGDSSDTDGDKRLSGPPLTPKALGLGRISETTEEEAMVEEEVEDDSLPQVPIVSPSQA